MSNEAEARQPGDEGGISATVDGAVKILILDRPSRRNAINVLMYNALEKTLKEADRDPAVRAVVLTGAGGNFTSGNDLHDFKNCLPMTAEAPQITFLQALSTFSKPLVGAISGRAVGIGVTMLLHLDLVYVSDSARLSLPFARLGLTPEGGSSLLLPRFVGHVRAFELLALGNELEGKEAVRLGLANEVVPDSSLRRYAIGKASLLTQLPPESIRLTKLLLKRASSESLAETLTSEAQIFGERLGSRDAMMAIEAFFSGRAAASKK